MGLVTERRDDLVRTTFAAMGTTVEVVVADGEAAEPARARHVPGDTGGERLPGGTGVERLLDEARRLVADWERRLSRFHPDSDISRINAAAGRWVPVHPGTMEVLRLAEDARRATGGWYHPGLGRAMRAAGYGVSFSELTPAPPLQRSGPTPWGEWPEPAPHSGDLALPVDRTAYELDERALRVKVVEGSEIDLGGIAKGWIVEQVASWLRGMGLRQFIVNAGGDMVCVGLCGERPWRVGIDDPFGGTAPALTLDVWDLALATSGTYRRRWQAGDGIVHHLMDPRTGRPAQTDVVSCTVLHERLVVAEVLAKVALLLGRDAGTAWLAGQPQRGWVMIAADGEVRHAWTGRKSG
ncbi:FAD:protein FMN transferase [Alicyclobacillus macrosporangiidus]|uniref:FAD:protein FMN transferase n=1 Tax=Alicyclobacillus macrosporangiidus TaxID=392015 RepID=A0A1I7FCA4_9BACL|nr:FAD:protein FMN transferase [Alicyclobacillus macrosporangiidus]SFU33755.1 thiamine biosynthesis lipoprotein [Alicyclobacillus macrosporangiidus]